MSGRAWMSIPRPISHLPQRYLAARPASRPSTEMWSARFRQEPSPGKKIRLRGKGIVSMKNPNAHGDQYVTIQIQVPTTLTAEQRQKLHEYENAMKQGGRSAA